MTKLPRVFWDTCVFLSHVKGESRPPDIQQGIEQTVDAFDKGQIMLVTSSVTLAEITQIKNQDAFGKFKDMWDRDNFAVYTCDEYVATLAGNLRSKYFVHNGEFADDGTPLGLMYGLGDSIQLASAMYAGVDRLVTLDKNDKKKQGALAMTANKVVQVDRYSIAVGQPFPHNGYQMKMHELVDEED